MWEMGKLQKQMHKEVTAAGTESTAGDWLEVSLDRSRERMDKIQV